MQRKKHARRKKQKRKRKRRIINVVSQNIRRGTATDVDTLRQNHDPPQSLMKNLDGDLEAVLERIGGKISMLSDVKTIEIIDMMKKNEHNAKNNIKAGEFILLFYFFFD